MTEHPTALDQAIVRYLVLRAEYERVQALADAAFARYFSKRQAGAPANGAAYSRLENRANYLSADLEGASFPLWQAELDPDTVWEAAQAKTKTGGAA